MNDMARSSLINNLLQSIEREGRDSIEKIEFFGMLRTICTLMERDQSLLVKRRSYSALR